MISQALAQTAENAAAAAVHAEAFYESPTFWVAVSFVIFILVVLSIGGWGIVTKMLDQRIDAIRERLDEAAQLREEAQEILADYKKKLAQAEIEAEGIISDAREEARLLRERMNDEMETALQRREKLALDRIAQAEADATAEVRTRTVDIAIDASRRLLAEAASGELADQLVEGSIKEIPEKLN